MNNQTKTVATVAAVAFAFMLISPFTGLSEKGYIDPIDTIEPLNPEVIGRWVGQLGGVPLIGAWVAVAVTARKYGWPSSLANAASALIGIPLVVTLFVCAVSLSLATPGEKPLAAESMWRRVFVAQMLLNCKDGLKRNPPSVAVDAESFCPCFAAAIADDLTREEIKNPGPNQPTMVAAIAQCRRRVAAR